MAKQNVTLSIESSVWEAFKKIPDIVASDEVEKFMQRKLSKLENPQEE